ncbi:uncharacterized protein MONBRDRAFT_22003 [Monosiga brevicollis MX1]|uniref:Uncharacterized protein n=1 Tax=Monosiga brevicollis TaxID=81824 RepID=A9UP91_MONBE|nr:uncharacterized protein MONBRDRAFT_22003 [Monosiga brevicollis MX1]EDQ92379.1 predicted protein [Monosiga brevicollis MX1]|eukprot:XP_001742141.1 hypothetical protein [Monosiga brevicollis MX1]
MSLSSGCAVHAVLSHAMPRQLTCRAYKDPDYHFARVPLPLPDHIVLYTVDSWPVHANTARAYLELGQDHTPLELGTLSRERNALASRVDVSSSSLQEAVRALEREQGLAKLVVLFGDSAVIQVGLLAPEAPRIQHTWSKTPRQESNKSKLHLSDSGHPSPEQLITSPLATLETLSQPQMDMEPDTSSPPCGSQSSQLLFQDTVKATPVVPSQPSPLEDRIPPAQATSTHPIKPPTQCKEASSPAKADEEAATSVSTPVSGRRSARRASRRNSTALTATDTPAKVAKTTRAPRSTSGTPDQPSGRWGHSFTSIGDGHRALLFGGQGDGFSMCKDYCWMYDSKADAWAVVDTSVPDMPQNRMGHTAVYREADKSIIIYGGAKLKRFLRKVHRYDTQAQSWSVIESQGAKGPALSYHSCTLHNDCLYIFGGNYPCPDPIPDGCSNKVHVFNLTHGDWYEPVVVGDVPSPRSGHAATMVDDDLYIFGGWDAPELFNDLYKLDVILMEFTRVSTQGQPPSPRFVMSCPPIL